MRRGAARLTPRYRRPRLEALESKRLLAILSLRATSDALYVEAQGSPIADEIVIRNLPDDDVRITITSAGMIPGVLQETYDIPTLEAIALTSGRTFLGFRLMGLGGDDRIDASGLKYHGNVTLEGGEGNDVLIGGHRNDTFFGGPGNDVIELADQMDDLSQAGGDGWDTVTYVDDVGLVGTSEGIVLVSDSVEWVRGTRDHDVIDLSGNNVSVTIFGRDGDDQLIGGAASDQIEGGVGRDVLIGGLGADRLNGGADNDRLVGGEGDDVLEGEAGDDVLFGEAGADTLLGGEGDDTLWGGEASDSLDGGDGVDLLEGEHGDDVLQGGAGDDLLRGGTGDDILRGQTGDDRLEGGEGSDQLDGGAGRDVADYRELVVTSLRVDLEVGSASDGDTIALGSVEDVEGTLLGSNTLVGDHRANRLIGGPEDDRLEGRDGPDELLGGDGADVIRGEGGDDLLDGGTGDDWLEGDGAFPIASAPFWIASEGNDRIYGREGDDTIFTNDSVDAIPAKSNFDQVSAGSGDDVVEGDDGVDVISGEEGADVLRGLAGADTLHGGSGDDYLHGGLGADVLVGSEGDDELVIEYLNAAGRLADVAAISGSGPDRMRVYGVDGPLSPLDEALATVQLLEPIDVIYSDYLSSVDALTFE
ncbi:MAG: hypothetical protein KDA61_08930 [Planctomycetales bacterium]|nr:hypothetical protein [Planctomycetales bacterium]